VLKKLYDDAWNDDARTVICVFETSQKETKPPIGFISFAIAGEFDVGF
jgi:hypothetical protein